MMVQPRQIPVVHHQPGTLVGGLQLLEGFSGPAEETLGLFEGAQLVLDEALKVVNVTQPDVSLLGADVLQVGLQTEQFGSAGVQIPGEVALQGLQFGLQILSSTDGEKKINNVLKRLIPGVI